MAKSNTRQTADDVVVEDASGNLDVTGTVSVDGLVVGGSATGTITLGDAGYNGTIQAPHTIHLDAQGAGESVVIKTQSTERMRIDSSGNVGIGCSPKRNLHIHSPAATSTKLQITNSSTGSNSDGDGFQIGIGNDGTANIEQRENKDLTFSTNNSERMRIDSSGNLLVSKSSSNANTAGHELLDYGRSIHTVNASTVQIINRLSNDGDMTIWQKDGTTIAGIGVSSSDNIYFAGASGSTRGLLINDQGYIPCGYSGAALDNTVDIGNGSYRYKDAYLSGGVYLGGTAAANKLDDYEEGTHQTVPTMSSSGTVTLNTSFDRISYTKVGRLVTINGNPRIASVSSPVGVLRFTLPFTALSGQADECRAGFVVYYFDDSAGNGSYAKQVNAYIQEGSSYVTVDLVHSYGNNITAGSSDEIYFSFSYITA